MDAFAAVRAGNHRQLAWSELVMRPRATGDERDCLKGFCGGTKPGRGSNVAKACDDCARGVNHGDESAMARFDHRAARDFDQYWRVSQRLIARLIHNAMIMERCAKENRRPLSESGRRTE